MTRGVERILVRRPAAHPLALGHPRADNPRVDTPAVVVALLLAVIPLVAIARRFNIPYPIVLVLGGAALGFLPELSLPELEPKVVFSVFLPPLLYWESVNAPTKELHRNGRWIVSLAIGLVVATALSVAGVMRWVLPGLPWAAALVLGAVLGPTDELAFVPMAERLRVPRRTTAVIEGESLLNDATALLLFAVAVDIVQSGHASASDAFVRLLWSGLGGIAFGAIICGAVLLSWRLLRDQQLGGVTAVLIPWLVYLPAERLHVSGVLALVVAGLIFSRFGPIRVMSPRARLQVVAFWEVIVFILNGILFCLVGLQLRPLLDGLVSQRYSPSTLAWCAVAVSLTVILVRLIWVYGELAVWLAIRRLKKPQPLTPDQVGAAWCRSTVIAWTGLRGGVSLAAALAIPTMAAGQPFPHRDLFIFVTFAVILVTLVGQGLTLPTVIRRLGVVDDGADALEEDLAGRRLARVALDRLDALAADLPPSVVETLRQRFSPRANMAPLLFGPASDGVGQITAEQATLDAAFDRAEREMLRAQRVAALDLRDRGEIDNTVMRRILASIDLALIRYEIGDPLAEGRASAG